MLPGIDGFEVCRSIRRSSDVPIVMVTARADTHDVVAGLEAGADDYLTKPFAPKELSARIRALLRRARTSEVSSPHLRFGDLEIVPEEGVVRRNGRDVHLTKTEFRVLVELAQSPAGCSAARCCSSGSGATATSATVGSSTSTSAGCAPRSRPTRPTPPRRHRPGPGLQAAGLTRPAVRRFPPHAPPRPPGPHHPGLRPRRAAAVGAPVGHHLGAHPREPPQPARGLGHGRRVPERRHRAAAAPGTPTPQALLGSLSTPLGSQPILFNGDEYVSLTPDVRPGRPPRPRCARWSCPASPPACATTSAARCSSRSASRSRPPSVAYFEIVSLDDLEDTLDALGDLPARRLARDHPGRRRARLVGQPPGPAPAHRRVHGRHGPGRRPPRHPARDQRRPRPARRSPRRSTTWPRPCRTASSATPASRPTSATSCARRS